MMIFLRFYKQNCDFSKKMLLWRGNRAFFEKKVGVAAARVVGGPPFSGHSKKNANVVKPMVLATFFVDVETARGQPPLTQPLMRQNPISASTVWGSKE